MRKIFLFLITLLLINSNTYASDNGVFTGNLTIKELSQNLENLKNKEKDFKVKNEKLKGEYGELISFIRTDITTEELNDIKDRIDLYVENKEELEKDLKEKIDKLLDTTDEKKQLILEMANLYRYLAKYVSFDKREDFIAHIKFQVQSEKESKDLIEEILKNQNLLDKKVTYIKEKIEDHKEDLQAKIEVKITAKIKQRIEEIDKNEKYKDIDVKVKNKIYNDFINQIKTRLEEIKKSNLSENYKEMRTNILNKMIDEIKNKIK